MTDEATANTDADTHFQRYIELIPIEIRRAAGAFGPWQWVVLSMIWEEASFADFLDYELSAVGPGFVAGCLALARPDKLTRVERDEFRRKLMFAKRAQLVSNLVGCKGSMVVRWLRKLQPDETLRAGLRFYLFAIANDPVKARVASHMPTLTFSTLEWLEWLPPWVCSVRLLEQLPHHAGGEFRDYVLTICRRVEKNHPERKASIARSLRSTRDADHLIDLVDLLTEHLGNAAPFPPAPLQEDKRLQPLTSARMMRSEGHWMHNCIGGLVRSVVAGSCYFYRWEGAEPATVCLVRNRSSGWELGECRGVGNSSLSPETMQQIGAAVQAALALDCH